LQFLDIAVVEEVAAEESDGVVGLVLVGFGECLGEHERDVLLLEVSDLGMLLAQKSL
jgi:hypothetical protein